MMPLPFKESTKPQTFLKSKPSGLNSRISEASDSGQFTIPSGGLSTPGSGGSSPAPGAGGTSPLKPGGGGWASTSPGSSSGGAKATEPGGGQGGGGGGSSLPGGGSSLPGGGGQMPSGSGQAPPEDRPPAEDPGAPRDVERDGAEQPDAETEEGGGTGVLVAGLVLLGGLVIVAALVSPDDEG